MLATSLALALAALAAATDPTYDCEEAASTISSSITSSGFTVELNDGAAAVMAQTVPGGAETYQHRLDSITSAARTYLQKLSDESDLPFTVVISAVPLRCTTGNIGAANFQYYHSCGCKAIYSLRCDQVIARENLPMILCTHRSPVRGYTGYYHMPYYVYVHYNNITPSFIQFACLAQPRQLLGADQLGTHLVILRSEVDTLPRPWWRR